MEPDIVERLRSEYHDYDCHALRLEAANEIERLRRELDQIQMPYQD